MILYHGTPEINALKIIEKGSLLNKCNRLWNSEMPLPDGNKKSFKTTDGYLYLTDKFSMAAFYGNSNRLNCEVDQSSYYVFRMEIPDNELEQDADELRMNWEIVNPNLTAMDSLEKCHCVSVSHPIDKEHYDIDYIKVSVRNIDAELTETIREICGLYKSEMKPDPEDVINKLNSIVNWTRL